MQLLCCFYKLLTVELLHVGLHWSNAALLFYGSYGPMLLSVVLSSATLCCIWLLLCVIVAGLLPSVGNLKLFSMLHWFDVVCGCLLACLLLVLVDFADMICWMQ